MNKVKKYLITGGCGFLGSNLSFETLQRKQDLIILDNLSRLGAEKNLNWLKSHPNAQQMTFCHGDVSKAEDVAEIVQKFKPDAIFHVAGQVAMTTSLERPRLDFSTNALGTFNILDAVRLYAPKASLIYSSTNKVYGDLESYQYREDETRYALEDYPQGLPEGVPLDFTTPYGCSKGCADQYIHDWSKMYGLKTVVFRHSSIFGGRQFATADQGWVGWFIQEALRRQKGLTKEALTISGNGKQVRDILFSSDLMNLYFLAEENIDRIAGDYFNIGGGIENSLSLLELFSLLEKNLEIKLPLNKLPPRKSDQKFFVADITKIREKIDWHPLITKEQGIEAMLKWTNEMMDTRNI